MCTRPSGTVISSTASQRQCWAPAAQVAATPGEGPVAVGSQLGSPTWTDVRQLPRILFPANTGAGAAPSCVKLLEASGQAPLGRQLHATGLQSK